MQPLPKVIMSAYACEPHTGSEPGVGWNWAVQAARHGNEVHVVTRANNRERIERELALHPVANLHFHYLDLPGVFRWAKGKGGYYGLLSYYYLWQAALAFRALRLHRRHRFDLAHHVTFVNDWMPSGLVALRIPFIWGPVGGSTHQLPPQIKLPLPAYARRHEWIRSAVQKLFSTLDPFVLATRARASRILVYTREALEGIPARHRAKTKPIIHIGVSGDELAQAQAAAPANGELRLVMGGRLVHWKGHDLMLHGFARAIEQGLPAAKLVVTGNGPYKPVLSGLVRQLGLQARVEFVGRLSGKADVCNLLCSCHLYALPTLHDGPPVAILEAMALGLPILCLKLGSTDEMVPDSAGLKIPAAGYDQVIKGIAEALLWAAAHRAELQNMGRRARAHVAECHNWDRIGDQVQALYEEILGRRRLTS